MSSEKYNIVIASDVNKRDGIGIEVYNDEELILEIFRDDTEMTRTVTLYRKDIQLDFLDECIRSFKKEIPWDFIDYNKLEHD